MTRPWLRCALGFVALLMVADFVFRGIVPSVQGEKNDFAEIYVGSWLWRHGGNFYDAALTTRTGNDIAGTHVNIVLIYPPSTLVLTAPFTYLPWRVADVLWLILELGGVAATVLLLIKLAGLRKGEDRALILGTIVLAFDPVHQAFHLGNIALIAVPVSLLGVSFAEKKRDLSAGVTLALASALKPQLGIWALGFYLLQLRKKVWAGAALVGALVMTGLVRYPVPTAALIAGYKQNLAYWFAPGRLYGFTEGALPFHVNVSQVLFYEFLHRTAAANFVAYSLFACGLATWGYCVWRTGFRASAPLAIASLTALSFISLYHSVADVSMLTLVLCWVLQGSQRTWDWTKYSCMVLVLLLGLPGHSALMRLTPHLSTLTLNSWWWKLLVARYFIWLLLGINGSLLYALAKSTRKQAAPF